MTTVDERIDGLANFVKLEVEYPFYYIYYIDSTNTLHKLKCLVDDEEIISEEEVAI